MTTDQAVEEPMPEPVEAPRFEPIQLPDIVLIDGLRQQISVLNDEVVRLRIDLDFKNRLVSELQSLLVAPDHEHGEHTHVHEEFDLDPAG